MFGSSRSAHLGRDYVVWNRPNQQRHSRLATRCAARSLEGSRESVGAVRHRAVLGGRHLICVLGGGGGDGMKRHATPTVQRVAEAVYYCRSRDRTFFTRPMTRSKLRDT